MRSGITDEFIEPVVIVDERNEPVGLIREEDACIFFNYRADRGREMTQALTERSRLKLHFTTMTQYDKTLTVPFVLSQGASATTSWPTSWPQMQLEKPARRRDREVRARHLLLQRRQ